MSITVHVVGKQEEFDDLAIRCVVTFQDRYYTARMLDLNDHRDIVLDGQRRILDGFELAEHFALPNVLRSLGEFNEPDYGYRGWITPFVYGTPLSRVDRIPFGGAILLLYEGCRLLDALARMEENGKNLNSFVRSLDAKTVVVSSTGSVTFTSLDQVYFQSDQRRADTELLGLRLTPGHAPGGVLEIRDSLFLLASLTAEKMVGKEAWKQALASEEGAFAALKALSLPSDLLSLMRDCLRWDRKQRPSVEDALERIEPIFERDWPHIRAWTDGLSEPTLLDAGLLQGADLQIHAWRGDDPPREQPKARYTMRQARKEALKREVERREAAEMVEAERREAAERLEGQKAQMREAAERVEAERRGEDFENERKRHQQEQEQKLKNQLKKQQTEILAAPKPIPFPPPPKNPAPKPRPVPITLKPPAIPLPPETTFLRPPPQSDYETAPTELVGKTTGSPTPPPPSPTPQQKITAPTPPSQETTLLRHTHWSDRRRELLLVTGFILLLGIGAALVSAGIYLHWF